MWGFLADDPPADLVECRRQLFAGVGNVTHHYTEGRRIADMVPESTLRLTVDGCRCRLARTMGRTDGRDRLSVIARVVVGVRHEEHGDR